MRFHCLTGPDSRCVSRAFYWPDPYPPSLRNPCRSEPARDSSLPADLVLTGVRKPNCGSELARDSFLSADLFLSGVHIHFCGHGCIGFRFYSESLSRSAKVTKALLPLSFGASPRLGMPSLRSCSVGPPPSAIPGRGRLTRHPCRVAHCAEPALGLTRGRAPQQRREAA